MVTQAPKRSSVAIALAFTLSCVGLMVFVWTQFGGVIPFAAQGYRVHAMFRETGLLVPNADVRISGVNVGKVISVEAKGVNSFVTMDIKKQYAPIPVDTRAILRQKTLLGEAYLELSTGQRNGPQFPDGGTIPSAQVDPTQALDQVLGSFDASTQAALQNLLTGFSASLAGRGEDLSDAIGNLDPATNELTALVNVLNDQSGNVQSVVANGGAVLTTLGSRSTDLQGLVTAGDSVLSATAQRNAALTATLAALPPFLSQLRDTLGRLDTTLGLAGPTLKVLRPVAPLLTPALSDVIRLSRPAVSLLRRVPGLVSIANRALPSIQSFLTAFDPGTRALLAAVREVAPVIQYAGTRADDIRASMVNLGAILQAQDTANTTQPVNNIPAGTAKYLRVLSPLNNEAIAGQSIRPPTNRHNVDYAPDEQNNLATGLLTSDCNNTGNTAQIPLPLGNGNVPCRVQPGVSFGGVTSYFPRLLRAPAK